MSTQCLHNRGAHLHRSRSAFLRSSSAGILRVFLLLSLSFSVASASPSASSGKAKGLSPERKARLERLSSDYLMARHDIQLRMTRHQEHKDLLRKQIRELKERNAQLQRKLAASPGELEPWKQAYRQQMNALLGQVRQALEERARFESEKQSRLHEYQQKRRQLLEN